MEIAEPVTLITDYLLAGVTGFLCWSLRTNRSRAARYWQAAFLGLAIGAFFGGTFHGFEVAALWKPTLLFVGLASFGMLVGSAYATTSGMVRVGLHVAAALKLGLYSIWMIRHDDFVFVVLDTASAMLAVAALHLLRLDHPASRWILGGVAVSLLAAGVQAGRVALHEHFNHNDLYHVVQIAAMFLYYAGVRRMTDFTGSAARP